MYVDYTFYSTVYGGKVPEAEFTPLEIQASTLVDYYTFNRIKEVTDKVKLAVCELIDLANSYGDTIKNGISSEKVGTYSVSYGSKTDVINSYQSSQKNIIFKYLAHTGMLYRGVYDVHKR